MEIESKMQTVLSVDHFSATKDLCEYEIQ